LYSSNKVKISNTILTTFEIEKKKKREKKMNRLSRVGCINCLSPKGM